MELSKFIKTIPNYPKEGIMFKDITPLLADGAAFQYACQKFIEFAKEIKADVIVGPESRGFIFGCPVASDLKIGFIPVRKPGKLPRETINYQYDLEYGTNTLCIHTDSIKPGQRVLIIDDLLATGGTVEAAAKLVEMLEGEVVGCAFLIELDDLNGRQKIAKYPVKTLMHF